MYTSFSEWFWELYMQSCMAGINLYSRLLENTVQLYTGKILSWESHKDTTHQILSFHGKPTPAHIWPHEIYFYDFPHHHSVSQEKWNTEMKTEYNKHHHAIFQKFIQDTQGIQESFMNYHKQFLRFTYQFISHLLNPLFQEAHYEQFRRKHIWVQWKDDNVIYAFTFSPEEMALYSEIDSLRASWEEIRKNITSWLSDVIWSLEEIHPTFEKIRLFDPDIDSTYWEDWVKDTKSGVSGFMAKFELFDPENYFLFEKELLKETHKWLEEALVQ